VFQEVTEYNARTPEVFLLPVWGRQVTDPAEEIELRQGPVADEALRVAVGHASGSGEGQRF
jgi:hypothetical protein